MRIALNVLLAIVAFWSSSILAMSLGEGHILNQVGDPFLARIELPGTFDPAVKFYPVRAAECRSSLIGKVVNDCESLYEGTISLSTWRKVDGQYALQLSAGRSDEMFYRVILKAVSASGGTTFKSYEFLPEFKSASEPPVLEDRTLDVVVDSGTSAGKLGLVKATEEEKTAPAAAKFAVAKEVKPVVQKQVQSPPKSKPAEKMAEVIPVVKRAVQSRLEIKKFGDYSDDIHALQNENVAIEAQIALLEKHIGLLKEVVRLKGQIGVSAVAEADVIAAPVASAVAKKPVAIPVPAAVAVPATETGLLTWFLLAVVLALSAAVGVMYARIKKINISTVDNNPAVLPATALNEMKSLDLTGVFVKPKW